MSRTVETSRPVPTNAQKAVIWRFAEDVARRLGLRPGGALEPIVSHLGGRIEFRSPQGQMPESMIVRSVSDFVIYLPTMTSPERDRFTIAHELGHFFIHYPLASRAQPDVPMVATRWVDETDPVQQRAEWEANWFAAAFLMPEAEFRQTYARLRSADVVADMFVVSAKAAEIRAKSLNLL